MAAYTQGRPLSAISIGEIMAKNVKTCRTTDSIETAEKLMQDHQIRRVPVVSLSDQLVGIVSLSDLARAAEVPSNRISATAIESTLAAVCKQPQRLTPTV